MVISEANLFTADDLCRLLTGVKRSGTGWVAMCPAHEDEKPSLSFRDGPNRLLANCFKGCTFEEIIAALNALKGGSPPRNDTMPPQRASSAPRTKVAEYPYTTTNGPAVKIRYSNKEMSWIKNGTPGLKGAKAHLYRLDEIQEKRPPSIVIPEGEKDVESLRALKPKVYATCKPNGSAEPFTDADAQLLVQAGVQKAAVLFDYDEPGMKLARSTVAACQKAGIESRLVPLPSGVLPLPEKGGKDVSDFLEAGGTREDLIDLIKATISWTPREAVEVSSAEPWPAKQAPAPDGKPTIIVSRSGKDDLNDLHTEVFEVVVGLNGVQPQVFQRSMYLTRVRPDDDGYLVIETFSEPSFTGYLAGAIRWLTVTQQADGSTSIEEGKKPKMKESLKAIHPPNAVVKNLLSRPQWPGIHVLRSIAQTPVFLADGTLVTKRGYHPQAQLWYEPPVNFDVVVPEEPTAQQVTAARELLLWMISDFPFDGDASRAHALAYFLLPFCRLMIPGPTPLHVFDAPTQGAGKGLLVDLGAVMSTGLQAPVVSVPDRDENELRKRITSQLLGGSPYIVLDNLVHPLRSAAVASALTMRYWADRTLGISKVERKLENRAVWVATGNNVELARDIARRAAVCRLQPVEEEPYLRDGFKEPELLGWAASNRVQLVSAALTLVRAWIVAGRPVVKHQTIGSFGPWANVMAGILSTAGVNGFLENFRETAASVDPELEGWQDLVRDWWERYQETPVLAVELLELAQKGILRPKDGDAMELGRMLGRMNGRVVGGRRIEKAPKTSKGRPWRLVTLVSVSPNAYEFPELLDQEHGRGEGSSGNSRGPEVTLTSVTSPDSGHSVGTLPLLGEEHWKAQP